MLMDYRVAKKLLDVPGSKLLLDGCVDHGGLFPL
jgi:hypothetical protein